MNTPSFFFCAIFIPKTYPPLSETRLPGWKRSRGKWHATGSQKQQKVCSPTWGFISFWREEKKSKRRQFLKTGSESNKIWFFFIGEGELLPSRALRHDSCSSPSYLILQIHLDQISLLYKTWLIERPASCLSRKYTIERCLSGLRIRWQAEG